MHKYRIFLCLIHNCLHPSGLGSKLVLTLINFAWINVLCMQIPPINLDFKKPFYCWAGNPGIFPELCPGSEMAGICWLTKLIPGW